MENPVVPQDRKWLIIFLIYADFTTNEKLPMIEKMKVMMNSMLGDIITTPINNDNSRMFVIMNSIKYRLDKTGNQIEDQTLFYTIEGTAEDGWNYIKTCEPIDNTAHYKSNSSGRQVLQKVPQLTSIFQKIKVKDDEEVFLITWDHGSSFGIFRQESPTLDSNIVRTAIDKNLEQYPFLKLFWDSVPIRNRERLVEKKSSVSSYTTINIGNDLMKMKNTQANLKVLEFHSQKNSFYNYDKTTKKIAFADPETLTPTQVNINLLLSFAQELGEAGFQGLLQDEIKLFPQASEILKNSELNEVLKLWLVGKKVGVLLMSNCWMMNMHTMYSLKETVKCLVAPQGNIDCPGYNLKDIFIQINKGVEPKELAKICVETIDNPYSKAKALMLAGSDPDVIERFKIFAVDLSKTMGRKNCLDQHINLFSNVIDLLVTELRQAACEQGELKFFLKYIRSACFDYSAHTTFMIDIVNWVKSFQAADNEYKGHDRRLPGLLRTPIIEFEKSVTRADSTVILKFSSGKKIYDSEGNNSAHLATIGLLPTGYSLFFPITGHVIEPNLKDNVESDKLLKKLSNWKEFLSFIDPSIDGFFS
jgi:hypothetical protein